MINSMKLTQEIKDKIKEIKRSNPKLLSVGLGEKVSNGKATGEPAIICSFLEKKPIDQLSENEILPNKVIVGDDTIKIDVIEEGQTYAFITCSNCGGWFGGASTGNRDFMRPLKPGLTISSTNNSGKIGTLGTFVKDTGTGAILGLTNNHVTVNDASFTSARNILTGEIKNDYVNINHVVQGREDGNMQAPGNRIGRSVRYVPITTMSQGLVLPNKVDAAAFNVEKNDVDYLDSWKPLGVSIGTNNPRFATTAELNNLFNDNPQIVFSGRTSGPMGDSNTGCWLRVNAVGVMAQIAYNVQGQQVVCEFEDCISVIRPDAETPNSQQPGCLNPGLPGDSGSAVYAKLTSGGGTVLVGLLFAGGCNMSDMPPEYNGNTCCTQIGTNSCSTRFLFCRIDHIAAELGVEWWDPSIDLDNFKVVNTESFENITEIGVSGDKIKNCNGKFYYQAGLTNDSDLTNDC